MREVKCDCGFELQGHVGGHLSGCPMTKPLFARLAEALAFDTDTIEHRTLTPVTEALVKCVEALEAGAQHYECDDPWYSCASLRDVPKPCNCGAQARVEALAALEAAVENARGEV